VARWLGYTFIAADDASWANFREVSLYELTAQAIKYALEKAIIDFEDIWSTDAVVWAKLMGAHDTSLIRRLELISPQTRFIWDEVNPDFWVSTKIRTIDPDVLQSGKINTLSVIDPEFADYRLAYIGRKKGRWPVRVG
jgi:hypothetical protein